MLKLPFDWIANGRIRISSLVKHRESNEPWWRHRGRHMAAELHPREFVITALYERLERLRDRLLDMGQGDWARDLLVAERSATTSGEAISNVTVVLRKLREAGDFVAEDLGQEVDGLLVLAVDSGTAATCRETFPRVRAPS